MLVLSWNIDLNQPYVYDLGADHNYQPFVRENLANYGDQLHIDFQSFPGFPTRVDARDICNRYDLDPDVYEHRAFCLLDEYYFFRTILEWEAERPTVVLKQEEDYRRTMTFNEFVALFAQTYRVIYHRWLAFDPSRVSMRVMFKADDNHDHIHTFREWMCRVIF